MASWAERVAKIVRERPTACPDCGGSEVICELYWGRSPAADKAIEPYRDLCGSVIGDVVHPSRPNGRYGRGLVEHVAIAGAK